jgi:hypothetical protein
MLVAVAATALVATGCAGTTKDSATDFKGEQKLVAVTVEDLQDAGRKGDEAKICNDLLAAELVAQIKRTGHKACPAALAKSLDDVDSYEVQVKKVAITGNRAIASIQSDDKDGKRADTLTLVKERGRWRIVALGA